MFLLPLVTPWRRCGNKTPLWWVQICILTGTFIPWLLWHFLHQFFYHLIFVLSENNFNKASRKNSEHSYFAVEIQVSLQVWTVQEFNAETTQSTIQKPTLQQQAVVGFTHMLPKTHNWAYSGLENKPQNMSRNIYNIFLGGLLGMRWGVVCWKFRCTEYVHSIRVNRSGFLP